MLKVPPAGTVPPGLNISVATAPFGLTRTLDNCWYAVFCDL